VRNLVESTQRRGGGRTEPSTIYRGELDNPASLFHAERLIKTCFNSRPRKTTRARLENPTNSRSWQRGAVAQSCSQPGATGQEGGGSRGAESQ